MNALVAPSSTGRQLGHHLIDGNNMLGLRDVLAQSTLSLNLVEDVARYTGNDSLFAQRPVNQTILEQLKVPSIIPKPVSKGNADSESPSVGSCNPSKTVDREDGVAEFKGPAVHGLVRFAQLNEQEARIEADFDGLTPGGLHRWAVNEFGDLREGAASTGSPYSPFLINSLVPTVEEEAAGVLGTLIADSHGHAAFVGKSSRLAVWDVIGRSIVLYQSSDNDHQEASCGGDAIAAAVIARSSVRGTVAGGAKRLCACDGTVVWQSG